LVYGGGTNSRGGSDEFPSSALSSNPSSLLLSAFEKVSGGGEKGFSSSKLLDLPRAKLLLMLLLPAEPLPLKLLLLLPPPLRPDADLERRSRWLSLEKLRLRFRLAAAEALVLLLLPRKLDDIFDETTVAAVKLPFLFLLACRNAPEARDWGTKADNR
jgi:hypothetical protein